MKSLLIYINERPDLVGKIFKDYYSKIYKWKINSIFEGEVYYTEVTEGKNYKMPLDDFLKNWMRNKIEIE